MFVNDNGAIPKRLRVNYDRSCPLLHPGVCAEGDIEFYPFLVDAAKKLDKLFIDNAPARRGEPCRISGSWEDGNDDRLEALVFFAHASHSPYYEGSLSVWMEAYQSGDPSPLVGFSFSKGRMVPKIAPTLLRPFFLPIAGTTLSSLSVSVLDVVPCCGLSDPSTVPMLCRDLWLEKRIRSQHVFWNASDELKTKTEVRPDAADAAGSPIHPGGDKSLLDLLRDGFKSLPSNQGEPSLRYINDDEDGSSDTSTGEMTLAAVKAHLDKSNHPNRVSAFLSMELALYH
jgi:hypothetical protein